MQIIPYTICIAKPDSITHNTKINHNILYIENNIMDYDFFITYIANKIFQKI